MRLSILLALASLFLLSPPSHAKKHKNPIVSISNGVLVASLNKSSGRYSLIETKGAGRSFGGAIGGPPSQVNIARGSDGQGSYQDLTFQYSSGARLGSIRLYDTSADAPSRLVILFKVTYQTDTNNTNDVAYPVLDTFPAGRHLSYLDQAFCGPDFQGLNATGVWLFWNAKDAWAISPASNFTVARMAQGPEGIRSFIDPGIAALPAGYSHETLLVLDSGIGRTLREWGGVIRALQRQNPNARPHDLSTDTLGYWTDNGSFYYYNPSDARAYQAALLDMRDYLQQQGVPVRYFQLDSWWYPKGADGHWQRGGGIYEYVAHPALFPGGLSGFESQLGLPVLTHSRWIDRSSPYRQLYNISNNVSVDPVLWQNMTGYIKQGGAFGYEQDWLCNPNGDEASAALPDEAAFFDQMAAACAANGLTIQYCMPRPSHVLQASQYPNVTTLRVSGDRFGRDRWDSALYAGMPVSALGKQPWADVCMSSEEGNLLLQTLLGMVGIGDAKGDVDRTNVMRCARGDGVVVKPDDPIAPIDASLDHDASSGRHGLMVAEAQTDFGSSQAHYVFAYDRDNQTETNVSLSLKDVGLSGPAFVYDFLTGAGQVLDSSPSGQSGFQELAPLPYAYYIIVPIGSSGIGFLGDADQYVSLGRQRIAGVSDEKGVLTVKVLFAPGEPGRTLRMYAPSVPSVRALSGTATGGVFTDGMFTVQVFPASDGTATISFRL